MCATIPMCAALACRGALRTSDCSGFPSQPLANDRREGVALAREHLQHLRELRFDDEESFVGGRRSVTVIERVADLGDQPFAGGEPGDQPAAGEVRVGGGEEVLDVVPA